MIKNVKRLLPFLLPLSMLFSCSTKVIPVSPNPPPSTDVKTVPNTDKMMRLLTPKGFAHACPVDFGNQAVYFTARHVASHTLPDDTIIYHKFSWEDNLGNKGYAKGTAVSEAKDIGMIEPTHGEPELFVHGSIPPVDSKIYWQEYVLDNHKNFMRSHIREATVLRFFAGHIVFDEQPTPGASGSCILNEAGEAVGVISWGFNVEYNKGVGVGVLF